MLDKIFDHKKIEEKIYKMWEEGGYFKPENCINIKNETFTVLMPPPNANAPLHCGHATYSIQDLMARWKRMQGYKVLYVPGTDHAGFETQVVYERHLKKQNKSRFDFDAKTLYNDILDFVKNNSNVAISQLKRIGMSADWTRNTFMLDRHVIDTVYNTFEKMYKDGLVYKDNYLVNYSPHHGTTFSNLETTHIDTISPLYFVKFPFKNDGNKYITVATVRPETIYADVAIAINPKDKRYKDMVGQTVLNPLTNEEMPIIEDAYVDMEFGTGALKITPGHDANDFEIGKKHNLKMISVIDLDGKMINALPAVNGMYVSKARIKTIEILQNNNAIEKIDDKYKHNLLVDYKDKKPIEPLLIPNWFVKMDTLTHKAINAIENNEIKFNKKTWKKQTLDWLNNIKDWPISRQIVFGIRIPVWYEVNSNPNMYVVFIDDSGTLHDGKIIDLLKEFSLDEIKKGLQKIISDKDSKIIVSKTSPGDTYIQETDTFDTWFSSGQWPLTTLHFPDGDDFKEFFPTSFMDSMWDILFFWIVRMIVFSLYLTDKVPFKNVYIHGRIDDAQGRKMSKSLGNVIDPLEFIEKYGADALRMGILVGSNTSAKTTPLSEDKVRGYRNFSNKIWNMARFMMMNIENYEKETNKKFIPINPDTLIEKLNEDDKKILFDLKQIILAVDKNLTKYRFSDAGDIVYHFMWDRLASEHIEQIKDRTDKDIALNVLYYVFAQSLKLIHPFMPFVTEEIWQNIPHKTPEFKPLIVAKWPTP